MDTTQTKAVMALITAYFPTPRLAPSTETAWADALRPLQHEAALQAVKDIGRHGMPHGRTFHISELVLRTEALEREANQGRFVYDRDMIEAIVPASEDEKRAILARYWDHVGRDRENGARMTYARRKGNPDEYIDAARDVAAQRIAEAALSPGEGAVAPERAVDPPGVLTTACGAQAGTEGVMNEAGVWCCPRCGSPISEGCMPMKEEQG